MLTTKPYSSLKMLSLVSQRNFDLFRPKSLMARGEKQHGPSANCGCGGDNTNDIKGNDLCDP